MTFHHILSSVDNYYSGKIKAFGPCPRGVDWNSSESQMLRFDRLLSLCDLSRPFSIIDYGCGYGALADFLIARAAGFQYCGFDISRAMINEAEKINRGADKCAFTCDKSLLTASEYAVASGIFNVRLQTHDQEWQSYMSATLDELAALTSRGFAFNALTVYSDKDRMRPDLYYADPLFWFDHCKRNYSRFVALLHDYPLYEFTIIVRK